MLLLVSCAPTLDNPSRFLEDQGDGCPDVQRDILWQRCALAGCHTTDDPTGGLELLTADVGLRLVDVDSTTCAGRKLIDSDAPEESFLLEMLSADPRCGGDSVEGMPLTGATLTPTELACVQGWVDDLIAARRASATSVAP
jgi:hypothetical protein